MNAQRPLGATQTGLPPGPRFAPLQTALYMRDAYGYTRRLRERYGDTVTMPSMNGQVVLTMTPAGAREVLDAPIDHYGESFASSALTPILGEASLFPISLLSSCTDSEIEHVRSRGSERFRYRV